MEMPWGKFKGVPIYELEDSYLWWLYGRDVHDYFLGEEIEQEAHARWPLKFVQHITQVNPDIPPPFSGDVKAIFRRLAMKYHPDHGGNNQAMAAINEFYELLNGSSA